MTRTPSRPRRPLLVFLLVGAAAGCARSPAAVAPAPAPARAPAATDLTSGDAVVRAMHDRYAAAWYGTLTFTQTTTLTQPNGGTLVQTWREAGKLPGRLRIDVDSLGQSGVIYAADSVFQFAGGRLARADTGLNPLLLLGFDVYRQAPEVTIATLRRRGLDLSKLSRSTWEGRPVYVVGALTGDTTSKQFWVDAERLLFVRLIEGRSTPSGTRYDDYRFMKYVRHGGGWVAEEVLLLSDGKPRLHEEYANVRVDVPLSDAVFDPHQATTSTRWY